MSLALVVSAPSGSGKTTLVRGLLARHPEALFSVSYTTRLPRGNEREGENYHYISVEEFESRAKAGEFLEYARVFGNYYGTHRSYWDRAQAAGRDLVLDIDVQGARQLKSKIPDAVSVFILAPSRSVLEQRLRARSEDSEETIRRRLREAGVEARNYAAYDYVVVNREVASAIETMSAILLAERARRGRMESEIQPILKTFETSLNGV